MAEVNEVEVGEVGDAAVAAAAHSVNFTTIDSWAVTYPLCHSATFNWTIKDFILASGKGKKLIMSPQFEEQSNFDSIHRERKWQLRLIPQPVDPATNRTFMSIHLYLLDSTARLMVLEKSDGKERMVESVQQEMTTRADFKISIVDANGGVIRKVGSDSDEACIFQIRAGWGYNFFFGMDSVLNKTKNYLTNGDLLLKCEVCVRSTDEMQTFRQGQGGAWWNTKNGDIKERKERLGADFGELFRRKLFADVIIQVASSNAKYAAHKMVLMGASPVFAAMFRAIHETQESQESILRIPDFDAPVVYAMLEYMYTDKIDPGFLQARCTDLFQIADKYCIVELREICKEVIAENLTPANCMDVLVLADMHHCTWLKQKCLAYIQTFRKSVMDQPSFWGVIKTHPSIIPDLYLSSK